MMMRAFNNNNRNNDFSFKNPHFCALVCIHTTLERQNICTRVKSYVFIVCLSCGGFLKLIIIITITIKIIIIIIIIAIITAIIIKINNYY